MSFPQFTHIQPVSGKGVDQAVKEGAIRFFQIIFIYFPGFFVSYVEDIGVETGIAAGKQILCD
jgi:hypothetical protein